jgi:uncharacterized protein YbjT (DUF2867 family)
MNNKILVTGATGNIGSHVLHLLQDENVNIVAGVHNGAIEGIDSVSIDYTDMDSLEKAMQGISTVFMVIPTHPDMIQWGKNLISAAKTSGIKHIVRLSTSLAKNNSQLKAIELLCTTDQNVKTSGIDYTIIAPQFFMQNFINFYADDYNSGAIYLPAGNGKIGWVDLMDIAAVSVAVLLNTEKFKGQTLDVTGNENLSYTEALDQMNEVLGKKSKYISVSDEAAIKAMQDKNFPSFIIEFMLSLNHAVVNGYAEEVTDVVEQLTGRKPISFKQFVADNKEAWS